MIGRQIAQFRVLEKIGEGGMGVVYKALDTRLNRNVALKVLAPERAGNVADGARLFHEARAASALNHPNIITIHDICTHEGSHIIVMEYISGRTLDALIPKKGMRLGEVLRIMIPIADALATAHASSITHRDLKPGNVIVGDSGVIKLLDFGLAKVPEATVIPFSDDTLRQSPRTKEGTIAGTVNYMSPEQAQGRRDLDGRSDTFSFGALLYEMVTGQKAFPGDSSISALAAILKDDPPPARQLTSDVPRDLEKVIARCLRKDPKRRFQHMGDVTLSLTELKEELDSGILSAAAPVAKARKKLWPLVAAGAVVLTLSVIEARRLMSPPAAGNQRLPVQLTTYPGDERHPVLSPDGNQVAFSWNGQNQDNDDIYVKLIGSSGAPLRLTSNPASDGWPAWSPNGQWIAFLRPVARQRLGVFLVAPLGGGERKVFEIAAFRANHESRPLWTPDSKWLLLADREAGEPVQSLFLFSVDSGVRRRITRPVEQDGSDYGASLPADGAELVFVRGNPAAATRLMSMPLSKEYQPTGEPKEITGGVNIRNTALSPDGSDLFFASGLVLPRGLMRLPRRRGGTPERVAGLFDTTQGITVARDRMVYSVRHRDVDIWKIGLKSLTVTDDHPVKLISSTLPEDYPEFSPDGRRIVFRSLQSGTAEIWVADAGGRNQYQLSNFGGPLPTLPAWMPDGKKIGFWVIRDDISEICLTPMEGGQMECPVKDKHLLSGPTFSPEGEWMYFTSSRGGSSQVWKSRVNGSEPTQVTHQGGSYVLGSRGSILYYEKNGSLWKADLDGDSEELLIEQVFVRNCALVKDGIYVSSPGQRTIRYFDAGSRSTREVITLDHPMSAGLSVSPDGRQMVYSQIDSRGSDLMLIEPWR